MRFTKLLRLSQLREGCTVTTGIAVQRRLLLNCMQRLVFMQALHTAKLSLMPGHSWCRCFVMSSQAG